MPLKGLVKFFTIAMILVCLFQLSITWFVNRKEAEIETRVNKQLKKDYPTPEAKYAGDKTLQNLYNDTLENIKTDLAIKAEAKAAKEPTAYWMNYKDAKKSQLQLGLDLQGGMSVTMEVAMDGLVKKLANNTKDANFNKAIDLALQRRANTSANFINLFRDAYKEINPTGNLASLFVSNSNGALKPESSESDVFSYLNKAATSAYESTVNVVTKRIDKFGLTQPGIYPNKENKTIAVEMAGVKNPAKIKEDLQSSANLEMWEVAPPYGEVGVTLQKAEASYLSDSTTTEKKKRFSEIVKRSQNIAPNSLGIVKDEDIVYLNEILKSSSFSSVLGENYKILLGKKEEKLKDDESPVYAIRTNGEDKAPVYGKMITTSSYNTDQFGKPEVSLSLDKDGETRFDELAQKLYSPTNPGSMAVVLDNIVYSAPSINAQKFYGRASISGSMDITEAKELSDVLNSGRLDAPVRIVQDNIVGATLGKDAINGGKWSFLISFAVIFILMLVYYNTAGWVANIALIANLLFTIGSLSMLGFTLTAPGIAGLVLTIGMAVDTNVIIFERIKEELEKGKTYAAAVAEGYKRSLSPVLDAHFTTFLTAFILFIFGIGPIKGFATTQMLGIVLSLFCGILVSRLITDWYTNKNRHFNYFTPLSKKIFKHAKFKFIEYRKVTYIISGIVLLLGVGAVLNGFDTGVEYAGGRSYVVQLPKVGGKTVEVSKLREALTPVFGNKTPIVKTVNGDKSNKFDITTSHLISDIKEKTIVDSLVRNALFNGLKPHLEANTTEQAFINGAKGLGVIASKKVEPSISDDLKNGAKKAAIYSILIIALYIFIRFRDWRYSLGTIIALLHDVLVTLAVFSFFKGFMPFPLELDQHFIAAILTVIGFSMNDTIIVFDRVRENAKKMKGASKEDIINTSINETLSRTIMTSLTVFLTILILFIFGGEVTRGFAFAMLVGVIVGTYSSIFVAAPILVDFAKKTPLGKADFIDHTNETTAAAEKAIR
jgi:SecD/SecF fusion protein